MKNLLINIPFLATKIIGISIQDYSAELIEIKVRGKKATMESYNHVAIPSETIVNGEVKNEEQLKEAMQMLFQSANPKAVKSKNIVLVLPAHNTFTHFFTFPKKLKTKEIHEAIPYELENIIPFSLKDVNWDFRSLEEQKKVDKKHESTLQQILFAAIEKKVVQKYSDIFESLELAPFLFTIKTDALVAAAQKQTTQNGATLVIDIGAVATNYLLMEHGKIVHFFSSNDNGRKLINTLVESSGLMKETILKKKEEKDLQDLFEPAIKDFIVKSLKRATKIVEVEGQNKKISQLTKIILTGNFIDLPEIVPLTQQFFPEPQIEFANPKINMRVNEKRFTKAKPIYAAHFTGAIGGALQGINGKINPINLIPEHLKAIFEEKKMSLFLTIGSITMTIIMLGIMTNFLFQYGQINFEKTELAIQKATIENTVNGSRYQEIKNKIIEFNSEVKILTELNHQLFSVPVVLEEIFDTFPGNIKLTEFLFENDTLIIEISGVAPTREELLAFQQELENIPYVISVNAPLSNYDTNTEISFSLELQLDFSQLPFYGTSTTQ